MRATSERVLSLNLRRKHLASVQKSVIHLKATWLHEAVVVHIRLASADVGLAYVVLRESWAALPRHDDFLLVYDWLYLNLGLLIGDLRRVWILDIAVEVDEVTLDGRSLVLLLEEVMMQFVDVAEVVLTCKHASDFTLLDVFIVAWQERILV